MRCRASRQFRPFRTPQAGISGETQTAVLGRYASGLTRAANGMTEDVAQSVGNRLMSADPAAMRSLADMFVMAEGRAAQPSIAPSTIAPCSTPHGSIRGSAGNTDRLNSFVLTPRA